MPPFMGLNTGVRAGNFIAIMYSIGDREEL